MQQQKMKCRYYENIYPKENDLVVVRVTDVQENAAYVELLEYNNIMGMIPSNEMTKAIRGGVQRALKIGQQQIVRVLRVDEEKGYIDVSKKKVQKDKDEEEECMSRYSNSNLVNSIMTAIAESTHQQIEYLYQTIVWPLYKRKEYDQPIHYFRLSLDNPEFAFQGLDMQADVKEKLMQEISRRLKPQAVTIRSEFEIQCWEYEGVLLIKQALLAGQQKSQDECIVSFEMKGSPVYSGKLVTSDKNKGIKVLKEALAVVEQYIINHKGLFKIKSEPKVIGDKMQDLMDRMQQVEEDSEEDDQQEEIEGMGDADDDEIDQQQT